MKKAAGYSQLDEANAAPLVAHTPQELGHALGLSVSESVLMAYRAELARMVAHHIAQSDLTHEEIAQRAETSRPKVSCLARMNTASISADLMIRVLGALGFTAHVQLRKSAGPKMPKAASGKKVTTPVRSKKAAA